MAMPNSSIEDVCGVIGFTATVTLIEWYGGCNIYVPGEATESHPLALLVGMPALRALCREYGSETVWVPREASAPKAASKRQVADALRSGSTIPQVAATMGLSERQVQRVRKDLEQRGVLAEMSA